jgi:flagellar motor switch protein FliG
MAASAVAPSLTGVQKAAILMVALGDAASAELLKHLSDEEIQAVSSAVANLPAFTAEQAEAVLEEFRGMTAEVAQMGHGGVNYAKRILTSAFGPEGSRKHVERLPSGSMGGSSASHQLQRADPQLLVRFVRTEHPQTVALILSHLSPAQSAAVLASMDAEVRADLSLRIAKLDQISPAVIAKISSVIGQKLRSIGEIQRESSGGPRAVAEIFNQLDAKLSDEILNQIGEQNAEMMEQIRQKMFVFNDLMTIDANGIKELLGRADRRQLTVALKGTSEELRQHLLQGMSQRGAAMLLEDMEALGPTKIRDVEAAQQQVIAVVRQLESEGLVSRNKGGGGGGAGGGGDDQYV